MTLENQSVIVVEDTQDDMYLISTILKHHDMDVHQAKNGTECLQLLETISPQLIITDLSMPHMDGWEMLAALRDNPQTATIPVVAVTAYYSVDVARDALENGFAAFFRKPVSPKEFVRDLEKILL